MQMAEGWLRTWICLSLLFAWARAARPRFDVSTDMGMVLVPADAEVDSAIFRLRATDQDADFPLVFEIIATTSPIVRVENLPCTLYNKVCQANVILTRRLVPGRLHDFVVRVRDSKGDVNSMQATISVTNSTTPRDKIFPHIPSLIMVPEDTKPEKELDYLLVESNPWSGKPVYIELWQPKELFKIRQRQMGSQTKGIITLIGELDFETQSMYTLTMYATDPYTEPGKDTRNIAGLHVVVVVQDVQDVPPVFTLAPPLTKINNTAKPGDVILRVHAEDGDKGVPREVTYGLISEGNPFTPFFNVSETTGEIILARPLEELTKITHVGAPIILKIVAEEIRTSRDEPPAQATVVELGLLLGESGNSPPYFENDNYVAWMDENAEPGTIVMFTDAYSTRVKDEDIGKAGVFALKLENNNGTFEISPAVAERTANFVITVRDNSLIDYEKFKSLRFKIVAQEVGPATNLSASVPVTIFLRDINDNPPIFDVPVYEVTLSENASAGTRVVQVHATDNDAGVFGRIQYVRIIGVGSEAFEMNPDNGLITVSMGSVLDREQTSRLELTVEARDEDGRGLRGIATLIVNILDVNDNAPIFEKGIYEFLLNAELTNFTMPAFIKAVDIDSEPPNNVVRYEIVHGNYDNKFQLNAETGELTLREAINKARKIRQNHRGNLTLNMRKQFRISDTEVLKNQTNVTTTSNSTESTFGDFHLLNNLTEADADFKNQSRRRRAEDTPLFLLTARAYDLGVPHLSNIAQIRIMRPMSPFARIVMFVMPGENPDPKKTAETLATITGSRVTIQEIKPYVPQINIENNNDLGKRSVVVAKVEQNGPGTLVDVEKIRESLAANGFGIISGMDGVGGDTSASPGSDINPNNSNSGRSNSKNISVIGTSSEEVTVYKAENKLLTWLLVLLGLLLLAAIITLIVCCICPSCPFYMEPRKRRIHSSETLVIRSDGRPKRHLHRKPIKVIDGYIERKEAWSADPARQHWQFNRRNTKNLAIASLPGDIVPGHQNTEIERLRRAASLRLHDQRSAEPAVFGEHVIHQTRVISMPAEDERIYMEDVEAQNRNYEQAEIDSLRRHELERGSDGVLRNGTIAAAVVGGNQERVREQHFYRDGNAEVLRLVTRGVVEDRKEFADRANELYHANGKDILLQRFIEDQKLRRSQDLRESFHESLHEADIDRSMEMHQRINNGPAEILIIPERLELQRQPSYNQRQHQQEQILNADIQRLIVERNYKSKDEEADEYRSTGALRAAMRDAETEAGEASRSVGNASGRDRNASCTMHDVDVELVRQNALLTRLLLEKEGRGLNVPLVDSSSFLETQSLPGQVAIATQTDRTAATQTEFFTRSRSDNEEAEEDPRIRRKSKLKGRLEAKEDFQKMKTIWVRTPIPEESRAQSGNKKVTPKRTQIEVTESRKVSISPDVLKEISNSCKSGESDGNKEDEEDEVFEQETKIKSDKTQQARKLTTKTVCTSKKKVKETRVDDDSTTPSPETKDKSNLVKSKVRKKIDKPPRKKLEKSSDSEKSHFMEPSFRVLEREINSFQQKIRQFGDKKLKMLKKDDSSSSSKKEKESKDNDSAVYDVSKKCEVTVKRSKKSVSRETSPTKISVEQKTKTSEESSSAKDKTTNQHQSNISSSDIEDFDKPKKQPSTNFSERTTQYEISKTQTRSRSKLRRQTNLENSDTKSSREKIEKYEDSERTKDSTSSMEIKLDSNSSSSIESVKQHESMDTHKMQKPQEKKILQSQRVAMKAKPTRMVDIKRKITSLKSKTVEEPSKRVSKKDEKANKTKSLTSDDSKSTSPTKSRESVQNIKLTTSEEEKSNRDAISSKSKESMAIDFEKLVKDVRGAVEKEISSLTQAAKDAISISKSGSVGKNDEKQQTPNRTNSSIGKNSNKIMDASKQEAGMKKTNENERMQKATESKEKREKMSDQKENSKSIECSSSSQSKSDEAISFIVIENKGSIMSLVEQNKKCEEPTTSSQSISKMDKDKKDEKLKRKDNGFTSDIETNAVDDKSKRLLEKSSESKAARMVSDEIDETKKMISSKIDETKKNVSDEINETKKIVSDHIDETQKSISDKINETKKIMSDKIDETNKSVSDTIDQTKKVFSDKIDETKQTISNKIDQSKTDATEDVDKTKKSISVKIHESIVKLDKDVKIGDMEQKTLKDKIDISAANTHVSTDRNKNLSDEIGVVEKSISDKIDNTEKKLAEEINKTSKNVSDTINESKKIVSTEIDKSLSKIDNTIENNDAKVEENIKISSTDDSVKTDSIHHSSDEIKETKNNVSDQIKESSKTAIGAIQKTSEKISSEINKAETKVSEVIDETKAKVSEVIQETKKAVIDKIDKSTDKLDENSKINAKQMSMEKQSNMLLDKKSKVDTTIVNAKSKTSSTLKDTESIDTDNVLLKSKSSSLPNETIAEDKKKAQEPQNEMNQAKVDNELTTIITTSEIKEITKELLEIEKTNASTQQQQEGEQIAPEKSITGLSGTSKEKASTIETAQMKQTKETKIHEEECLNKEDSASTGDSNKAKETSSTEMTQLKQMKETEMQRVQRADKKEFTSTSSDQTQETNQEVSQLKQAQGQANTANRMVSTSDGKVVSSPSNTENKVKSASSKEENKTAIKLLPARAAAAAAAAADHLNKPIVKVTNATTDEAEDESDEDDSSSASDISNKTALRTRPYSTPRHSISSDGGGTGDIVVVETPRLEKSADDVKSSGKPRQKWSTGRERDPPLKVEAHQQSRDFSKAVFPQKIEVSPMDKPKISMAKAASDQTKAQKSPTKETRTTSTTTKSIGHADGKTSEVTESRHRSESSRTRPVVVSVKKKEHHSRSDHFTRHAAETRKNPSPRREKETTKSEDKRSQQQSQSEQRKVEIRSKHLKLHVSHHYRQPKDEAAAAGGSPKEDKSSGKASEPSRIPSPRREKDAAAAATTTTGESHTTANATGRIIDYGKDPEIDNARSRYMAWYQQKRTEMERKRRERKEAEEEQQRPKWMKRPVPPGKSRKAKSANDGDQLTADTKQSSRPRERAKSSSDAAQSTPKMGRLRIKPLVNVESEQLKAIVRQGRKLRKAEGTRPEDPPVQIFALEKPSQPPVDPLATTMHLEPRHHLTQHSEYKYEKTVPTMPFYLHPPPPVPHPSPEHFQDDSSDSRRLDDDLDSGIAVSLQGGGTRLRHQQLLEKKSVFDIAYNEAAPTQLRSDSSTPPS